MTKILWSLIVTLILLARAPAQSIQNPLPENGRQVTLDNTLVKVLHSKHTGEDYDIYFSLPINNSDKILYPVLFVLDAEVNFGAVSYIVLRLIKDSLIPDMLVVGVAYHGDTNEAEYYSIRAKDFTPTVDKEQEIHNPEKYNLGSGGAENFIHFLSDELFPYINSNFKIALDDKAIYGHSFGGLLGAQLLLHHSEMFNRYVLLSPSLWWDHSVTLKSTQLNKKSIANDSRVYIATGSLEGNMVNDQQLFVNNLKHSNSDHLKVKSEILSDETHRSIFGRGFTNGLRYIFSNELPKSNFDKVKSSKSK